jgi:hypothetical protein
LGCATRKIADLFQHLLLLQRWEYAHARCRKQKQGRVRDICERYLLERVAEKVVEVFGADIVRVFSESRDTRMYLLGPLLVCLYDRQAVQLRLGSLLPRLLVVQPAVYMDARPLSMVSSNPATVALRERIYLRRTQHPGQHHISLQTKCRQQPVHIAAGVVWRRILRTLSHVNRQGWKPLLGEAHTATDNSAKARRCGKGDTTARRS